jgi:hypothetical protein
MAEYKDREHYIPLRKSDLVDLLCADKHLTAETRGPFRQLCELASALFHFEYQKQLDGLKDDYAPFDPDAETRPLHPPAAAEMPKLLDNLFADFDALMERANFKRYHETAINRAVCNDTMTGLRTDIDPGVFDRLHVFVRGDSTVKVSRRSWLTFWRREEITVPIYRRLVVICKLRKHRRLPREANAAKVYLKIFKDIPKHDLEMLLPGARVRLSRMDFGLIVYPLVAGVALLLYNMCNDIWEVGLGALATFVTFKLATWSMAAAFSGYGYKSYHSYQVKKQNYNLRLARSLYFQTLDSNEGVLTHLLDEAEEQECRETFLGYFCLRFFAPPQGWTSEQLDDYVEMYLEGAANLKVDFEVGDALAKLERLHMVERDGNFYKAIPLDRALEILDEKWDTIFMYHNDAVSRAASL